MYTLLSSAVTRKFRFLTKSGFLKILFDRQPVRTNFVAKHGRGIYNGGDCGGLPPGGHVFGELLGSGSTVCRPGN